MTEIVLGYQCERYLFDIIYLCMVTTKSVLSHPSLITLCFILHTTKSCKKTSTLDDEQVRKIYKHIHFYLPSAELAAQAHMGYMSLDKFRRSQLYESRTTCNIFCNKMLVTVSSREFDMPTLAMNFRVTNNTLRLDRQIEVYLFRRNNNLKFRNKTVRS